MTPRGSAAAEPRFLTPQEVAAQLRVSPAVVLRLLRRGELPALRVGRLWRIDEEEFRRWTRRRWHGRGGIRAAANGGRNAVCLCGCGDTVTGADARFLPGHSGKMVHRLMAKEGMTFDAARETVRRIQRPRQQQRLF
jgi:excisionase family DNA binding protein